jgi:hypothetical protein
MTAKGVAYPTVALFYLPSSVSHAQVTEADRHETDQTIGAKGTYI